MYNFDKSFLIECITKIKNVLCEFLYMVFRIEYKPSKLGGNSYTDIMYTSSQN